MHCKHWGPLSFILPCVVGALLGSGCTASDFAPLDCNLALTRQCDGGEQSVCLDSVSAQVVDPRVRSDLDVLFVIDNSASMAQKQEQLAQAFATYIQQLEANGYDYHVGVVTADIGTLPPGSPSPDLADPRCGTLKGDDGVLQNLSCRERTQNTSAEFRAACDAHCPTSIMPAQRFIAKDQGVLNVADPVAAFKCMALVGDGGCEVQAPLEAMKRALDQHLQENQGFLRDNAPLAIFFITDKDDYSVQLSQRSQLTPASMDCGTTSPDPNSSCYSREYRGTAKGILCDQPLNVPGPKTGCRERTASFLEPLDKYSRFLSALRTADKLLLGGLWAPSMLDYETGAGTPYGSGQLIVESTDTRTPPSQATNFLTRGRGQSAACVNPDPSLTTDPKGYFGLAQLRLAEFKSRFDPSIWTQESICDPQKYGALTLRLPNVILGGRGTDCLGVKPNRDCIDQAACLVGYVPDSEPYGIPDSFLPQCSAGCCDSWADSVQPFGPYGASPPFTFDPKIAAACTPEPADCYCTVESRRGLCSGTSLPGVWRQGGARPLPTKLVSYRCAGTRPTLPGSSGVAR